MGYLFDNIPPGRIDVLCHDLYPFRIKVLPAFFETYEIQLQVKDVIPDVEEWQYSGKRPSDGRLIFAFHTDVQRDAAAARFNTLGLNFIVENEPA